MANLRRTMPHADGITVRRELRTLFQRYRPISAMRGLRFLQRNLTSGPYFAGRLFLF
jgi:hypothetical protein